MNARTPRNAMGTLIPKIRTNLKILGPLVAWTDVKCSNPRSGSVGNYFCPDKYAISGIKVPSTLRGVLLGYEPLIVATLTVLPISDHSDTLMSLAAPWFRKSICIDPTQGQYVHHLAIKLH